MDIAVIGTGFIGGTLGRALAGSGHRVTFGSRHPGDDDVVMHSTAALTTIPDALAAADVVLIAVPGPSVAELAARHGAALDGKLVIDATNTMGAPVTNARGSLSTTIR